MSVFAILLLLLLTVPMIEIYVLIEVGRAIGSVSTVILVVLTAVAGAWLLRWQGLVTLARVRSALERGEIPALELVEGLLLLVTGALLLTPGFVTDVVGFAVLIPPLRRLVAISAARKLVVHSVDRQRSPGPRTLHADYRVEDD